MWSVWSVWVRGAMGAPDGHGGARVVAAVGRGWWKGSVPGSELTGRPRVMRYLAPPEPRPKPLPILTKTCKYTWRDREGRESR